jgi:hypothetical protein
MSFDELKTQVGLLISAAVEGATKSSIELDQLRGIAVYDSRKDSYVTSLEPFAAVEASIGELPLIHERYGAGQSRRLALQLVYEYFARAKALAVDSALLETLWADFVSELEAPAWLTRCVTNLRYFDYQDLHVELGDGVSIYRRDQRVLAGLGFSDGILERLFASWSDFGASSFVLVAESSMPKQPESFIRVDINAGWLRCTRAIGAMRLIAPGDVGISTVFGQRVARFNVGIGGIFGSGSTVDTSGSPFAWPPEQRLPYEEAYTALARLEKLGYGRGPGNLDLALCASMSTFDRFPTAMDTKLVDAITALEAVLGGETEIAFKLSFRVASLLAATNEERATLLKTIKCFYDARSRIIHGGRLGKKQNASLAAVDDLRDIVRRLLRSFVLFAANDARPTDARLFGEELDASLVNAARREELRRLLGLTESASPTA